VRKQQLIAAQTDDKHDRFASLEAPLHFVQHESGSRGFSRIIGSRHVYVVTT
jgi:hypothetical protein